MDKEKFQKRIAKNLIFVRHEYLELKQEEVAVRMGITSRTYSKYETGGSIPNALFLAKYSKTFNVDLNFLICNSVDRVFLNKDDIRVLQYLNNLNMEDVVEGLKKQKAEGRK